ncbi:TetR/AcrR family transcriptional regulator [Streptomyces sp. 8L]|uniref:TetR/AcrR family transcriptional regulator n=1 Tax=Streptomyces sp. 8L TaxID=2877242 RepID=UPI001CD207C7|nr:TetR/AcrR family transcriptional regulator [Streptomyces sp. 8L]MCA1217025.1 TetR/AcrR family transcriptional regulator [Streptomyces sp. 8L]
MSADRTARPGNGAVPTRSDARRNRERVLTAAREIFAERGLDTQMDEVASRAGVGLGTVYRHFPTKAALAAELIADKFDTMALAARSAADERAGGQAALEEALRRALGQLESDAGARAAMAGSTHLDHTGVQTALRNFLDTLGTALARAQAEGTTRADITVSDLGMILCGMSASIDSRSYTGWERHLALVFDGIRVAAGHAALPAARSRPGPKTS